MSVLNLQVLKLNAAWQPFGYTTVKEAIIAMCGKPGGTIPALALDVELDDKGNMTKAIPTKWADWIKLPVGSNEAIGTKTGQIRAPRILVDPNYSKVAIKRRKLSSRAILERDGYVDQYTGEKLSPIDANVDHVISRDVWKKRGLKGSPDQWTNMVCCAKERNRRKSNKTAGSLGMTLLKRPVEPLPIPASFLLKPKHESHVCFLPQKA